MRDLRNLRVSDGTEAENREFHAEKGLRKRGSAIRPEGVEYTALPEREMRKAPTERVAARAGVGAYENLKIDDFFL